MPIFQDDLTDGRGTSPREPSLSPLSQPPAKRDVITRKLSEESIRTELCEGHVLDDIEKQKADSAREPETSFEFTEHSPPDRIKLIQRLKRRQNATWLPNRDLESILPERPHTPPQKPAPNTPSASLLLPSPEIEGCDRSPPQDVDHYQAGLQIERPRSALHSGDFTEPSHQSGNAIHGHLATNSPLYGLERSPWISTSPPRDFSPYLIDPRFPPTERLEFPGSFHSRAPSLSSSLSSSFVLKPPTSPLVHSESNDDVDLASHINPIDITLDSQRNPRRHTLQSSQSSQSLHSSLYSPGSVSFNRPLPHLRRDSTYPYQAHQPRRSLTSNNISQSLSSPQTPVFLRSRRPSFSDSSPLHASMVGSYEESILRGRMSTTPSKPLDFVAQIGVLGLGKCKPSLKCPAHVTIPFPAVFYSYNTTTHGRVGKPEDGPSPYVGQIDLENHLSNQEDARESKRKRHSAIVERSRPDYLETTDGINLNQPSERDIRRNEKQKRRSTSPKAPPGGSYRIPEKGQLQIIIKNPNKTAVKLFLVPYDLAGMEPGTKTFIRQRSYSAGPIIDSGLSSTSQRPGQDASDRPTLRYLVHLHICSPSRGRFYLYKSIRVVFANRVPDGKEKLRNEVSIPEPRFSVYKPGRDSIPGLGSSSAGANLAAEKASRRRSAGLPLGHSNRAFDAMDGITQALERGFSGGNGNANGRGSSATPVEAIPFSFARKPRPLDEDAGLERPSNIQSLTSSKSSRPPTSQGSQMSLSWRSNSNSNNSPSFGGYDKLNKGDLGYGGHVFGGYPDGKQGAAEGLLAKKLRDLGVGMQSHSENPGGA